MPLGGAAHATAATSAFTARVAGDTEDRVVIKPEGVAFAPGDGVGVARVAGITYARDGADRGYLVFAGLKATFPDGFGLAWAAGSITGLDVSGGGLIITSKHAIRFQSDSFEFEFEIPEGAALCNFKGYTQGTAVAKPIQFINDPTTDATPIISRAGKSNQSADVHKFQDFDGNTNSAFNAAAVLLVDNATKGVILKSANAHYWRVTVSDLGVIVAADLGTSRPTT